MKKSPARRFEKPTPRAWVSALARRVSDICHNQKMLLAYIDEIGEPGAFIARNHPRFNTSAAFGYAGFIVPSDSARYFGAIFDTEKRRLFKAEIEAAEHPGRWERKGSSIFRPDTNTRFPHQLRVFNYLVRRIRELGGCLFYYADEKPLGTPAQTRLDVVERETVAMRESLNRIARHADHRNMNVMVMIDQINERQRSERLPKMYAQSITTLLRSRSTAGWRHLTRWAL